MSSATEMWLSAENTSVPAGRPTSSPRACACRFFGAPKPSGGYKVAVLGCVDIIDLSSKAEWSPCDGQFVHAVRQVVMLERNLFDRDGQPQRGNPPEQRREDDLQLCASQLLTYALVSAITECDVLACLCAVKVETVGFGERLGVPVRGCEVDDDALSGADHFTRNLDVFGRDTTLAVLDDRQVAQQLFHCVRNNAGVFGLANHRQLFRILKQRAHSEPDHVRCRLMPRDQ